MLEFGKWMLMLAARTMLKLSFYRIYVGMKSEYCGSMASNETSIDNTVLRHIRQPIRNKVLRLTNHPYQLDRVQSED